MNPPQHRSVVRWIFWAFAAVGAYFLLTEHRAHVYEYLPYALLLACPLLHLFHGHGTHGGHRDEKDERPVSS
jgi:hypothetical protein